MAITGLGLATAATADAVESKGTTHSRVGNPYQNLQNARVGLVAARQAAAARIKALEAEVNSEDAKRAELTKKVQDAQKRELDLAFNPSAKAPDFEVAAANTQKAKSDLENFEARVPQARTGYADAVARGIDGDPGVKNALHGVFLNEDYTFALDISEKTNQRKLKKKKSRNLLARNSDGQPIRWSSTTKKVCAVKGFTLKAKNKKGTCKLTANAVGLTSSAPVKFTIRIKIA